MFTWITSDRFIKCKNTIDDIYSKLQHNELDTSSESASTELLMQSLGHVKLESSKIFDPLIERQHEREKLIGLINTYHRYASFCFLLIFSIAPFLSLFLSKK